MSMANPRIVELADNLFPIIGNFFIKQETKGRPRVGLRDINVYLQEQQKLGNISGLTFRGTHSYQVEAVVNSYVMRGLLNEERSTLSLSPYGKKILLENDG